MSRYEIAFAGELAPGAVPEQVKANLAKLFQADAQRIEALFSGRRIVIKTDLDQATAEKYRALMARAGAVAQMVDLEPEVEEIELTVPVAADRFTATSAPAAISAAPESAPVVAPSQRARVIPRDEYMAAFVDVEAPDFGIAPVGADLQDAKAAVPAPALDLSQFSVAPVGSDMGQLPRDVGGPVPDTSHLRLQ